MVYDICRCVFFCVCIISFASCEAAIQISKVTKDKPTIITSNCGEKNVKHMVH